MFGVEDRYPAPERFSGALDQLHEVTARHIGSSDFGDGDYLPALRVLLESMDYDPHFSERGRTVAWGMLIMGLGGRGQAFGAMRRTPGFERVEISRPIVITGLHRTGTTALHKLLAVDPQFQGLEGWLIGSPIPRPPREQWADHPLFQEMAHRLAARFAGIPGFQAAHDMAAGEVDECVGILAQSFLSSFWTCAWSAPSYDAWWQTQSERPAYRYYRKTLQLIGSNEPGKRWLLKNPAHLSNLDLLFETLPDALVIQTHRDPAKAVPSLCSLLMMNHPLMEVGRADQRARLMGWRETAKAALAVQRAEAVRAAHRDQVMDVIHGDFHRDPMRVIRRIYPFIGAELTPEVEAAMQARIAAAPEAQHGAHRYDATDFGITEEEIRDQFTDYIERFDLAPRG